MRAAAPDLRSRLCNRHEKSRRERGWIRLGSSVNSTTRQIAAHWHPRKQTRSTALLSRVQPRGRRRRLLQLHDLSGPERQPGRRTVERASQGPRLGRVHAAPRVFFREALNERGGIRSADSNKRKALMIGRKPRGQPHQGANELDIGVDGVLHFQAQARERPTLLPMQGKARSAAQRQRRALMSDVDPPPGIVTKKRDPSGPQLLRKRQHFRGLVP